MINWQDQTNLLSVRISNYRKIIIDETAEKKHCRIVVTVPVTNVWERWGGVLYKNQHPAVRQSWVIVGHPIPDVFKTFKVILKNCWFVVTHPRIYHCVGGRLFFMQPNREEKTEKNYSTVEPKASVFDEWAS